MRVSKKRQVFVALVGISLLSLIIFGFGCGGGGGDDGVPPPFCEKVAGLWNTTEEVDATECGQGIYTEFNTYTVTQQGCIITVMPGTGGTYAGTVSGNQISWTGSWPEDGGTVTAEIVLTISGDSLSGSASWTWSDGIDSCSGTTQITGTRTKASVRFFNNLSCGNQNFWAYLDIGEVSLASYSGSWSNCEPIAPGTHSWSLYADAGVCGELSASGSIPLDPDCVYDFVLTLDGGGNPVLGYLLTCPGDCDTPTPFFTGVSLESLYDDASFKLLMKVPIESEGFKSAQ